MAGPKELSSEAEPPKRKIRVAKKKAAKSVESEMASDAEPETPVKKKSKTTTTNNKDSPKPKKTKAPPHQVLTERDEIPKLWDESKAQSNGSYTFKIATWNVAGIRALLKKFPNVFRELVDKHNLDVLCLQETKLQESHLEDPKLKLKESIQLPDYDQFWTCSTAKKGYAGTAVFIRKRGAKGSKKQTTIDGYFGGKKETASSNETEHQKLPIPPDELVPQTVSYTMGIDDHDKEGRIVMVDMPLFSFCNVYTPNSGQKLERLSYRVDQWDKDFLQFMQNKQAERKLPVFWLGDLNVAHTNLEVWNDGAKHLPKQAGVTPQERASFTEQLDAGFIDAFRKLHPTAGGHYTYWSTRAGNREPNKGLRLDYFVCDPSLFDETSSVVVRDSFMDYEQLGSDHCPAILELEIKP